MFCRVIRSTVCANEKHSRNGERWPARSYSSSNAGSGVVLRHGAAPAACVCLTVDAAAACCTPEYASRWISAQPLPQFKGFLQVFF